MIPEGWIYSNFVLGHPTGAIASLFNKGLTATLFYKGLTENPEKRLSLKALSSNFIQRDKPAQRFWLNGCWSMVAGQWFQLNGCWSMVSAQWFQLTVLAPEADLIDLFLVGRLKLYI
ncbi:hypothetical protein [Methanosarcina barkeri]|nr:hypothetical protein [Methanosarcina barkeri]